MSTANSVLSGVIPRAQSAAGQKGQTLDEAGGKAFAAIMRTTKSPAVRNAATDGHAHPGRAAIALPASAWKHGQQPVADDATGKPGLGIDPAAETTAGASVTAGTVTAVEGEPAPTTAEMPQKATALPGSAAEPMTRFVVAEPTAAMAPGSAAVPAVTGEQAEVTPDIAANPLPGEPKKAQSPGSGHTATGQAAAAHDTRADAVRMDHRRERENQGSKSDALAATSVAADPDPRADRTESAGKRPDTADKKDLRDIEAADDTQATPSVQDKHDAVIAMLPAAQHQASPTRIKPADRMGGAIETEAQATEHNAAASETTTAVSENTAAASDIGAAEQRSTTVGKPATQEKPASASDGPKSAPVTSATAMAALPSTAATQASATAEVPATAPVRPTPTRAPTIVETSQAAAPHAFRAELTMAAANYAIFSGKSQVVSADAGTSAEAVADAPAPEIASQPIRVAILPTRTPQTAQGLMVSTIPVTVATAPAVPTAQAQRETAGEALMAGQHDALRIDRDEARSKSRAEQPAVPAPQRSGAADGALLQPAAPAAGGVTSTVVAAIASEASSRPVNVAALSQLSTSSIAPEPKTLSIQLHPAELGVVTATLRLTGDQLTVEISADSHEARSRLSADSHAIAKSLRALGFDVDQVTIIQPVITQQSPARTDDASAVPTPQLRDQQSSGAGTSGGGGGRLGGQQAERNGNENGSASRSPGTPAADRGSGGLYI